MNVSDENALCEQWRRETTRLNTIIDEEYKGAQDHAYNLGLKRAQADALCLEKQYSESLGQLARLCDVVCPWVIDQDRLVAISKVVPASVITAAEEIMQYVDAVRPPEPVTLFQCGPSKCDHDYQGHEDILNEAGKCVGGTTVCTKCGARASDEAAWP